MEFTPDTIRTRGSTTSELTTAHTDPECVLDQATVDVGFKNLSFKSALTEPAITTTKEMVPWFLKRIISWHIVMKANEELAGTFVESDSNSTYYSL